MNRRNMNSASALLAAQQLSQSMGSAIATDRRGNAIRKNELGLWVPVNPSCRTCGNRSHGPHSCLATLNARFDTSAPNSHHSAPMSPEMAFELQKLVRVYRRDHPERFFGRPERQQQQPAQQNPMAAWAANFDRGVHQTHRQRSRRQFRQAQQARAAAVEANRLDLAPPADPLGEWAEQLQTGAGQRTRLQATNNVAPAQQNGFTSSQ